MQVRRSIVGMGHLALAVGCLVAIGCAPTLTSVTINSGEATTNTRSVTLNLVGPGVSSPDPQVTQYLASESPLFSGATWQPFTSSAIPFTLSTGDGLKTVYVKLRNSANEESQAQSDTIYLIETTPKRWMRAVDVAANSEDEAYCITTTSDGGYVVGGLTIPTDGDGTSKGVLTKIGSDGSVQTIQTFGLDGHNQILDAVRPTLEGGVIAAGGAYDDATGNTHVWVSKYDQNLNLTWAQSYPLDDVPVPPPTDGTTLPVLTSYASDVRTLASGGYIVAGTADYDAVNGTRGGMFLLRLDSAGNMVNYRIYNGAAGVLRFGNSVTRLSDGSLVLAGQRLQGTTPQAVIMKVNSSLTDHNADLTLVWTNTFYGDTALGVTAAPDDGIIYCGSVAHGPDNVNEAFIARVTPDGAQDNSFGMAFGGAGSDRLDSIALDLDGGFALAGSTSSYGNGLQAWLIKTDSRGKLVFQHTFGNSDTDDAKSIVIGPDGGYAMAGFTESGGGSRGGDMFVIKTDSLGVTSPVITP